MSDPKPNPRRTYLVAGGLLSVAVGLLFALVACAIVGILAGNPTEGGYCSQWGIGEYEARPPAMVVYIDEGWSGLPPRERCRVYRVTATHRNPPLSGEEQLQRAPSPHRLLAEGAYPGNEEYAWIVGAFLFPLAIWTLPLALAGLVLAIARVARLRSRAA